MISSELAILVHAKRIGKGKWRTLCPVHGDRMASLDFTDGKVGILLNCRSHQCDVKAICQAWGIGVGELFFGKISTDVRSRLILDNRSKLKSMEHRRNVLLWLESEDRNLHSGVLPWSLSMYYLKAQKGLEKDIRQLRDTLYPDEALNRRREQEFKRNLRLYGWSGLWKQVLPEFKNG